MSKAEYILFIVTFVWLTYLSFRVSQLSEYTFFNINCIKEIFEMLFKITGYKPKK